MHIVKDYSIEEYKKITNYDNTKKVLNEIKPELPSENEVIKDFQKENCIFLNVERQIAKEERFKHFEKEI